MTSPRRGSEAERLAALQGLGVLDTPPEQDFDDIVHLAAQICGAPIALISLLDDRRQWFKARVGLDRAETPRDFAFCAHALELGHQPLVVADAREDPRFADNPLVTGETGFRFYAGAPLVLPSGHALGTLCVIDRIPRELTSDQLKALGILSNQVVTQMRLRRQLRERARIEAELKTQEIRLRAAIEGSDQGVWDWNLITNEVYFSEAWCRHLGYDPSEVPPRFEEWSKRVHPDDREVALAAVEAHLEGRTPFYRAEMRMRAKSGEYRWILGQGRVLEFTADGRPLRIVGTHIDITTRKQAEEALRRSEERFQLAVRGSAAGIWDWNIATGAVWFAPRYLEMLGYEPSAAPLTWSGLHPHLHPEDQGRVKEAIRAHFEEHRPYNVEFRLQTARGDYRWFRGTGQAVFDERGKPYRMVGSTFDITERRHAEMERLRLLEILEATLNEIYVFDADTFLIEFTNAAARRNLGYTTEELSKLTALDIGLLYTRDAMVEGLGPLYRDERPKLVIATRHRRKNGTLYPVESHVQKVTLGGRTVFVGMVIDVTERLEAERTLREQAALIDEAHDAIAVRGLDHQVRFWSKGAERLYGWSINEARGRSLPELLRPERDAFLSAEQQVRESGSWSGELRKLARDGRVIVVESRWTLLRNEAGEPLAILSFDTDVTERKKLEQQFLRAQRTESIGTLAGGIAHDLNNLLTPILIGVDLIKEADVDDAVRREVIANIERSARRGSELVKQVLSFARGVEGERVPVQLRHAFHEIEEIVKGTFPKNIRLRMVMPEDLWVVAGDPTQLNQVLLNLAVNARDAMPQGGQLSLLASNVVIDEQFAVTNKGAASGRHVCVEVSDEGCGIPSEMLERIFEPFFTTKPQGQGTGLGLSTTQGIVRSHGGFINVYSEPGKGSTFKIYLPASGERPGADHGPEQGRSPPRGAGELVLLVDDEASILSVTRQTLEAFGYRVLTAEDGAAAIAQYAVNKEEVKLVVTDMMMPVMDGPALISALHRLSPRLPVIAASGLNANAQVARATVAGVRYFIGKPYSADALLRLVHEALHGAAEGETAP